MTRSARPPGACPSLPEGASSTGGEVFSSRDNRMAVSTGMRRLPCTTSLRRVIENPYSFSPLRGDRFREASGTPPSVSLQARWRVPASWGLSAGPRSESQHRDPSIFLRATGHARPAAGTERGACCVAEQGGDGFHWRTTESCVRRVHMVSHDTQVKRRRWFRGATVDAHR